MNNKLKKMKTYSNIFNQKIKENKQIKNKDKLNKRETNNQNSHKNFIEIDNLKHNNNFRILSEWEINDIKNEINDNEKNKLMKKPTISFINNKINDRIYNNSSNFFKRYNQEDNNKLNNLFDNINCKKEII